MYIKKILQVAFISTAILALVGCSSSHPASVVDGVAGVDDGSATATGVGDGTSFDNSDSGFNTDPMKVGNHSYYFDFDRSSVRGSDVASIQVQAHYLATHPKARVLLTGNTDERGSREYNIGLGEHRNTSVASILAAAGVSKSQITSVSYGAEKPIALGHDDNSYTKNRRVDLIFRSAIE